MKICVVGAGTMGAGIAQVFAGAGYSVALCDISEEYAANGKKGIEKGLAKQVERGRMEQAAADALLGNITTGLAATGAAGAGLVIEAVKEDMGIKKSLFASLEGVVAEDCIFATNTSSLSITEMSLGLNKPLVGMHFFNPAPVMKLVEVICGMLTPPETLAVIKELCEKIGKTAVEVKEAPGFVVNRILIPMINEAIGIFAEGVASAADIDEAMKLGANHPIGPLALGDLVGLDIVLAIMEVLMDETGDQKYRPHPLLKKMVRAGQLGRKTKQGFFAY